MALGMQLLFYWLIGMASELQSFARLDGETPFAKKMTGAQDCNDRFLALLGNDRELDLAFLDVKNRVRGLSL
jgi:hypothetical protein